MDDKVSNTISNICTILGGALLLYPLIDEATRKLAPEIQKLTSGDMAEQIKALPQETLPHTQDAHEPHESPQRGQLHQQPATPTHAPETPQNADDVPQPC